MIVFLCVLSFVFGFSICLLFVVSSRDLVILKDSEQVVEKEFVKELQRRYSFALQHAGLEDSDT